MGFFLATDETASDVEIRAMSRSQLELAIGWARDEGWNRVHDATAFHAADPEGFRPAALDGGKPISSISVGAMAKMFGFLGFYIVIPQEARPRDGFRLPQAGMARLQPAAGGPRRCQAKQDNYRRSGFELPYRNIRYGGTAPAGRVGGLRDARTVPFGQLLTLDARLFPAPRSVSSPGGSACRRARRSPHWMTASCAASACAGGALHRPQDRTPLRHRRA